MLRSLLIFLPILTILSGCITTPEKASPLFKGEHSQCFQLLSDFYTSIETHRTYLLPYAQDQRFPYLAFDRFSTSFSQELNDSQSSQQWLSYVGKMGRLQLETALKLAPREEQNVDTYLKCQADLTAKSASLPAFWLSISQQPPEIETAYQHWKRVVGIYPIGSLIAEGRIEEEQAHIQSAFHRPLAHPFQYGDKREPISDVKAILEQARRGSLLRWPQLNEDQEAVLLGHFSPVISVETLSKDDLPGALLFDERDQNLTIETKQPTLYQGITYTRFQGDVLVQLNYIVWFPARTAKSTFDPYAGEFDAINIRLTLDNNGHPLILDSIHQCGCFHMVYSLNPTLTFLPSDGERPIEMSLPTPSNHSRLHVSLSAGEHMITQVSFTDNIQPDIPLSPAPLLSLAALPSGDGQHKSPFDRDGILSESARGERWFLWPFGVRSPGAMRQQGQHAIAFIGERHFDDAFLFENVLQREDK
ncbi:hypothetical protein LRP49_09065 [Enterovibrio sp. ZSDZ35]|uniref:Uncharacterized protein n=1 Tax=Enterovibrio qingdaonensis TaxID=2899818 RepID=A0ABT5QK42_9GAMM|nr:hypothetical protein [Enterovibrio sp. ZSDZ35]MDD1781352.1 hypothetical protein [Enterovibrio sp. ZSDZ35]